VIDKRVGSLAEAVEGIGDGATVLVSGFGDAGIPVELCHAVLDLGVTDLTIVTNNAGSGETDVAALIRERRVRRIVCSYPRSMGSIWFEERWRAGEIELELVPQGTLSERMRAAAAGLGGFFTPTGADTLLAEGKEVRMIGGRRHVFEEPLPGDVALVRAARADRWGNLTYRLAARNFGPTMAAAAALTVVQVDEFVELGALDPECVVTPGIFVDRVVRVPRAQEEVA
jgi:3-oxoadipate CoA-transferase alpha subunit